MQVNVKLYIYTLNKLPLEIYMHMHPSHWEPSFKTYNVDKIFTLSLNYKLTKP